MNIYHNSLSVTPAAQEISSMFQKKMGYTLPPEEYYLLWKFKSRLVAGRRPPD